MTVQDLCTLISDTNLYNLHSHTQYCDGRATIGEIVKAAYYNGFKIWGVSPHSPICVDSPCNMTLGAVPEYIKEIENLKKDYDGKLTLLTGMEIDYLGKDFGPHIDYFQNLDLEFRIGSVHFVPTQEGMPVDCDGSAGRFAENLRKHYRSDLRYVVEKYFEQVLMMLESGGFEILGHFDKIIGNAIEADASLENKDWYESLIKDVIELAVSQGIIVEINTKAFVSRGRFYPSERWWPLIKNAKIPIAVNSDCHHPDLTNLGREEAFKKLEAADN